MRFAYCLFALSLLAACGKPVAYVPNASKAEIAQERAEQERLLQAVPANKVSENVTFTDAQLVQMQQRLTHIVKKVAPQATTMCRELHGPEADCNMRVQLDPKGKGVNAHADGTKIVVYPAMMAFATDDSQLAFVLAHEYSHHMMEHVQSTQGNVLIGTLLGSALDIAAGTQGVSTGGAFGKVGGQGALLTYSPSFEHEADYIGLYVLARSGYPLDKAPHFWREMAKNNPKGIYNRTTHPTTPERFVMMRKTIEEINQKRSAGLKLLPNIKQNS